MNAPWLIAEFLGTFALILIGAGSICVNEMFRDSVGLVGIAIAHGITIAVMVSALAQFSGAKLNPAISLGLYIGKIVNLKNALYEIGAQLAGAIVAAIFLKFIFPDFVTQTVSLGTPLLAAGVHPAVGIFAEFLMSFLLILTVYGTAVDPRGSFNAIAGFGIGSIIVVNIMAFGPITGAAINPARAFGPALVSWTWTDQYVYWIGPILGGLAAGYLYSRWMLDQKKR